MKKFIIIFLFSFISFLNVYADDMKLSAESAVLMEASTGKILYEKNKDKALAPASMTKMMTLLVTMEKVDEGIVHLNDKVVVSKNASDMGGSQVYLEEGATYKLEDIIKAVSIASANDGAVVLAETIGGSVDNFVSLMNKKAKELGLSSTSFINPYGLDAKGHYSSSLDMAKIARELLKYERILKYTGMYEDHLKKADGTSLWMVNTNKLVRFYNGVDGLKTGFTDQAGYCITATGKWNNLRLIAVVMKEPTREDRDKDATALLNYGKSNYKIKKLLDKNKKVGTIKVDLSDKNTNDIYLKEDISYLYKSNQKEETYSYIVKTKNVSAPLKKGSVVGQIKVYSNKKKKGIYDLIVKEDIKKCSILKLFKRIIKISISGSI